MDRDPALEALANSLSLLLDGEYNRDLDNFLGVHAERNAIYVTTEDAETGALVEYRAKLERL